MKSCVRKVSTYCKVTNITRILLNNSDTTSFCDFNFIPLYFDYCSLMPVCITLAELTSESQSLDITVLI